ncbi:MAG TPA: hypothetical protein VI968_01330 [archaeon]|nr:hypothetical protein [archaeon]
MSRKKGVIKKLIMGLIVVLSGVFVFTTADVKSEVVTMFLGSIGSVSLLTIIFFLAGMLGDSSIKEKIRPYAVVFALFIIWIIIFTMLRIIIKF